jgi:hypothetical protein
MAYPTTNIRFLYHSLSFLTERRNLHAASEPKNCAFHLTFQDHIWTGIRSQDARDGTGFTDINCPIMRRCCVTDKAAFFNIPTAKVIAIKEFTFKPEWCLHCNFISLKICPQENSGTD